MRAGCHRQPLRHRSNKHTTTFRPRSPCAGQATRLHLHQEPRPRISAGAAAVNPGQRGRVLSPPEDQLGRRQNPSHANAASRPRRGGLGPLGPLRAEVARTAPCPRGAQESSGGTSTQARRCQDSRPFSASCTPLAPSNKFQGKGSSQTTWRRNSSHCTLKALS